MTQTIFRTKSIQQSFEEFNAANPKVYGMFKTFAATLKGYGKKKIGSKLIMERIRWEMVATTETEDFKINNNFSSRYARKLIAEFPEFDGMFELRELKAE